MKASSAKNKGNRFENYLVEVFRKELCEKSHRTYGSGAGLDKADVRIPSFNIEVEAKNQAKINLTDWWEQTCRQKIDNLSVLAIRNPKKAEFQETLVVLDLQDFIELVRNSKESVTIESNFSSQLKWKVKRLKDAANDVFKELE